MKKLFLKKIVRAIVSIVTGVSATIIFFFILSPIFNWIDNKLFPIDFSDFSGGKNAAIGSLALQWVCYLSSCFMGGLCCAIVAIGNIKILSLIIGAIISIAFLSIISMPDTDTSLYDEYIDKIIIIWGTPFVLIAGSFCGGSIGMRIKKKIKPRAEKSA